MNMPLFRTQVMVLPLLLWSGFAARIPAATLTSPDEASLRAAVATGGPVTLAFDGTIALSNTLVIANSVTLDASNHSVVLSGRGAVRIFTVSPGATLALRHLTLANGFSTNGGAIYNQGTLQMVDCVCSNNHALGTAGMQGTNGSLGGIVNIAGMMYGVPGGPGGPGSDGASGAGGVIFNTGSFSATNTLFIGNAAQGGPGGNGGPGGSGVGWPGSNGGNGGTGANGGTGFGGALYNLGSAALSQVEFAANEVRGGTGGNGGSGAYGYASGQAGIAGTGAPGYGGAIYNLGLLNLSGCSVAENTSIGGQGGNSSGPLNGGPGGLGSGGGIVNAGTNLLLNVTVGMNSAIGGVGGSGAQHGNGGNARAGGVQNGGYISATNCTLWNNSCSGGSSSGTNYSGTNGISFATTLDTAGGQLFLANSILGNLGLGSNCLGSITDLGYNLGSDGSALFVSPGSSNNVNPLLGPLARNGGFGRTFALWSDSPAIDAGNPIAYPPADQRGVTRPQGSRSDIGAYEYAISSWVAPVVAVSFATNVVAMGSPVALQIRIINPNAGPLTGVCFTNGLPSSMSVAPTPNVLNLCGPGTVTAPSGSHDISGSGLVLAAGLDCVLSIDVVCSQPGEWSAGTLVVATAETGLAYPSTPNLLRVEATPAVLTAPAENISSTSLTLNGMATPAGASTVVFFEWGLTVNPGNVTEGQNLGNGFDSIAFSAPVNNLLPNRTYYFRAVATNGYGVNRGLIRLATTLGIKPTVTTDPVENVTTNSVTLRANANPNGGSTWAYFEWGLTPNLGNVTPGQSLGDGFGSVSFPAALTNLLSEQTCFYRAVATNAFGTVWGLTRSVLIPSGVVAINNEALLRANLAKGKTIRLAFDGNMALSNTLVISTDTVLDARNHSVVLSGHGAVRVFEVSPGATLLLRHLTIANGFSTNGGGIYNQGTVTLVDCVCSNNHAVGADGIHGTNGPSGGWGYGGAGPGSDGSNGGMACGGAIFNSGMVDANNTLFIRNAALGGLGGNGGNGGFGGCGLDRYGRFAAGFPGGLGGNGGNGGSVLGGALYNLGTAYLTQVEFATNEVRAGAAGNSGNGGGSGGPPASPGNAGVAGIGGASSGGALYNLGLLYLTSSSVAQNRVVAGRGGSVGDGGIEASGYPGATSTPKNGGPGGAGIGGGIANAGTNILVNVTVGLNWALGADAGRGGYGSAAPYYGQAGNGGSGSGGGIHNTGQIWATNCTLWNNWTMAGLSPSYSTNGTNYPVGTNGVALAFTLDTTGGQSFLANSILGNLGSSSNCLGLLSDGGYNLCSDGSYPFSSPGSLVNVDPALGPLVDNGGFGRTFALLAGSPALDAGSPADYPYADQCGVLRPQGLRSDIGAVEKLRFSIRKVVTGLELYYCGSPNASCTLQKTTDFSHWDDLGTKLAGPDGVVVMTLAYPQSSNLFFRIKTWP